MPLEPTNEAYSVAKIAAIKICQFYHQQFDANFISVMPTNLYGPGDNYDLKTSHVLPALIRKSHLARLASEGNWEEIERDRFKLGEIPSDIEASLRAIAKSSGHNIPHACKQQGPESLPAVAIWGSGNPRREFLHVDDLADACVFLMNRVDADWIRRQGISHINIGTGQDIAISDLAQMICNIVGYKGDVLYDANKPDGTLKKLLDVSRLRGLGWKHQISLREGIENTYECYRGLTARGSSNNGTK
jgi:GDP-L-fucose synthase